ncbi:MAG: tetratricopeptide repeat protein, partial [bacterium]|nr:tetratricopeptide repeat protein [bacterium]
MKKLVLIFLFTLCNLLFSISFAEVNNDQIVALRWAEATSYTAIKDYYSAIPIFRSIITNFPNHDKASEAQIKIGYCYIKLLDKANAIVEMQKVVANYPTSQWAPEAQFRLGSVERSMSLFTTQLVPNADTTKLFIDCLQKAIAEYSKVTANYPETNDWVAQAYLHITSMELELALNKIHTYYEARETAKMVLQKYAYRN